ncbi:MAG: class I SAM-dependent methyltransferase [Thioalkalivibrio sp.]|nr:class I SAM-dependent methyltransferase [Thioalkalivibrio sp.]
MTCPVCGEGSARLFASVGGRDYLRCGNCHATFLHPDQLPSPQVERNEYGQHRNLPEDPAYRVFLGQLAAPLLERLSPTRSGLDYGCGPGPALAAMLQEAGHQVTLYDPFFHSDPGALEARYDFITCTEVVEHFHQPAREFARLSALLKPGGLLAIQTCLQTDDAHFARWNYRRDPTHVVFYREETFLRIARRHDWIMEIPARNVVFLTRATRSPALIM